MTSGQLQDVQEYYARLPQANRKRTCLRALTLFDRYTDRLNLTWGDFLYDLTIHDGELKYLRESYQNQVEYGTTGMDIFQRAQRIDHIDPVTGEVRAEFAEILD